MEVSFARAGQVRLDDGAVLACRPVVTANWSKLDSCDKVYLENRILEVTENLTLGSTGIGQLEFYD